jgi:predicted SprT family Zn-dependent metalloprotease
VPDTPTKQAYARLDAAYDFFNKRLFDGKLPRCLITMQRHRGTYGYFCGERFERAGESEEVADEMALNPDHFDGRSQEDGLSTLVHEMVHVWQFHFGKPPLDRDGYHNKQWAAMMKDVGLIPSDTGKPGGAETGRGMSHYIEEGGPFAVACAAYLKTGEAFLYRSRSSTGRDRSKKRYICPKCKLTVWGQFGIHLICGTCSARMDQIDAKRPSSRGHAFPNADAGGI